ncbi:hypothetical protein WDZ92_36640, partial [Nostoc sp. NIES-2111]
ANMITPTSGRAILRGSVASLLEPRNNIDRSLSPAAIIEGHVRLTRQSSAAKALAQETVLSFAELKGFEHLPADKLSSGMRLRLSLSLALSGDPDILLLDDVLGVGDTAFQEKCMSRLTEMKRAGKTIVFVSGDDTLISDLATRVVTLDAGRVVEDGEAGFVSEGLADERYRLKVLPAHASDERATLAGVEAELYRSADAVFAKVRLRYTVTLSGRFRPALDVVRGGVVVFRTIAPDPVEAGAGETLEGQVDVPVHLLGAGEYHLHPCLSASAQGRDTLLPSASVRQLTVSGRTSRFIPHIERELDCNVSLVPFKEEAA